MSIVPWCTGTDLLTRMGEDTDKSGLSMEKVDFYAGIATEALYRLSGRQWKGTGTRTVVARIGRSRHHQVAKITLGPWWPVTGVSGVTVLPWGGTSATPVVLDTTDWSWSGGIAVTVPWNYAGMRAEMLLQYGQDPPPAGKLAAIAMGVELAVNDPEYDGEVDTRLPSLVTSISRQGVTQTFATVLDVLKEGATGIQEVDLFTLEFNTAKTRSRPHVRTMR